MKNIGIVRPSLVYGNRPGVGLMVMFMKFMSIFPGKSEYKPILVQYLANEIIQICE